MKTKTLIPLWLLLMASTAAAVPTSDPRDPSIPPTGLGRLFGDPGQFTLSCAVRSTSSTVATIGFSATYPNLSVAYVSSGGTWSAWSNLAPGCVQTDATEVVVRLRYAGSHPGSGDSAARVDLREHCLGADPEHLYSDAEDGEIYITLLIGEAENSIRQGPLNRWLHQVGFTPIEDWIRPTHLVLRALEREVCDDLAYVWTLGAFLPDVPSVRDVGIIRRNSATLRRAGYGYVAQRIEQELEADPDVGQTFERVRESFPARARAAELRRVQAVRQAAEAEGFAPAPGM